jgi:hypothetical protein
MKLVLFFILPFYLFFTEPQTAHDPATNTKPNSKATPTSDCPSGYDVFWGFEKLIKTPKFKCYGRPAAEFKQWFCPNIQVGTCSGVYYTQDFCYNGIIKKLYFTDTKCTCGCADKNFHGKSLHILDVQPCACDDGEEKIGVDW